MKAFRILFRSFRDAFKSVVRNFSLSFASIMCTTITLIIVSIAIIVAANIDHSTKLIESELNIVVYLNRDVTEENIKNITEDIKSYDTVKKDGVIFKSKDEWKLEMEKTSETFNTVLNYLDENPLLNSIIVQVSDVKDLSKTAEYIKSIKGVETVKYGEGMVETVISAFDIVEKVVVVVVIALVIVTAFLIGNTIKLTIFSRKNEIEIMRLVGASNLSIKLPFLIEGFVIGLIGAIIPVAVTIYGYVILNAKLGGQLFTKMILLIEPYNFVFWVSLVLVLIGSVVGMFGSLRAVRKYLKI
ncbi:MAG: permease-like cell division protein FtsX [Bacilli bacterium]